MMDEAEAPAPPQLILRFTRGCVRRWRRAGRPCGGRSTHCRPAHGRGLPEPLLRAAPQEAGRAGRLAVPDRPLRRSPRAHARALRAGHPRRRPRGRPGPSRPQGSSARRGRSSGCSGNPSPCAHALEAYTPGPDEDVYPVIEIAWQNGGAAEEGVRPRPRSPRRLLGDHDGRRVRTSLATPTSATTASAGSCGPCTRSSPSGSATTAPAAASRFRPMPPSRGS